DRGAPRRARRRRGPGPRWRGAAAPHRTLLRRRLSGALVGICTTKAPRIAGRVPLYARMMLQEGDLDAPREAAEDVSGAPTEPGADRAERLLAELNEPQCEAVRH